MTKKMPKSWYANLQSLRAIGITDKDVLLVKLLTIEQSDTIALTEKICSARIIEKPNVIEWRINDYMGSELIIETPKNLKRLGRAVVEDEDSSTRTIYIIAGYYVFKTDVDDENYKFTIEIKENDKIRLHVNALGEVNNIMKSLKAVGIEAKAVRNYPENEIH